MTESSEAVARVRLDAAPEDILKRLTAVGRVMMIGQAEGVTHERIGPVEDVMAREGFARLSGAAHDSEIMTMRLHQVTLDCSMTMKDKAFPRLDFLAEDGARAFSIVGLEGVEPFNAALGAIDREPAADDQDETASPDRGELADDDPGIGPFQAAVESGSEVGIEFRNPYMRQSWMGRIEEVRPAMGFLNVMTADFHLHLKAGAVAEWRIETGVRGATLAAYDAKGAALGLRLRSERLADLGADHPGLSPHPAETWVSPDDGEPIDTVGLMRELVKKKVVLLGETHDRADIHIWQRDVAANLLSYGADIALGFEMFPRRVQPALDAWTAGEVTEAEFLEASEWKDVWGFPAELYLPLFRLARAFRLPMLALNCRRGLVTEVGKHGWDAIPEADRDGLTPAKPATPAYRKYLFDIAGAAGAGPETRDHMDPSWDRFVRAQQCWDRAFACNIARALGRPDAPLVVGIIGRGHLEFGHGVEFQLADLGVSDVATLLPSDAPEFDPSATAGIARAVFRLPA